MSFSFQEGEFQMVTTRSDRKNVLNRFVFVCFPFYFYFAFSTDSLFLFYLVLSSCVVVRSFPNLFLNRRSRLSR